MRARFLAMRTAPYPTIGNHQVGPSANGVRLLRAHRQAVAARERHDPGCNDRRRAHSTKNAAQARDPEMKQNPQGNTWYFGMKLHIGTDLPGRVHIVTATMRT